MAKTLEIKQAATVLATLPWPTYGAGDELIGQPIYGRTRSGSLRTYINRDANIVTTSWEFQHIPLATYNTMLTGLASNIENVLTILMKVDGVVRITYSGTIKTAIMEARHERNGLVSFNMQFSGTRVATW